MLTLKNVLFLASFLFVYIILSFPYFSGDVKNHIVWGTSILDEGTSGFYQREFHNFSFPN